MEKDTVYYIWLSLACGPVSTAPPKLFSHYDDAYSIYNADDEEIRSLDFLSDVQKSALCNKDLDNARSIIKFCIKNKIGLLSIHDKLYPARLRRIDSPPVILYYKGILPDFDNTVCIAMVGTRHATNSGRRAAYNISRDLTFAGAVTVSGMALGIDSLVAKGAIDVGGHTVAILGCGIDVVYPPQHEDLMNRITISGTVMTEYPPHTEPKGYNFPQRNRIISGLCQGTVVVEGDFKSGALITAKHALVQGRDIFAVPGDIYSPMSYAPNSLLKNGARLVTCAEDILTEYIAAYPFTLDLERMKRMRKQIFETDDHVFLPRKVASPHPEETGFYNRDFSSESIHRVDEKKEKKKILKFLGKKSEIEPESKPDNTVISKKLDTMTDTDRKVFAKLKGDSGVTVDDLCSEDLSASDILTSLTMLEIEGLIEAMPGGYYKRK